MNQTRFLLTLLALGILISFAGCKKDAYVSLNGFPIIDASSSLWEIERVENGCTIFAYLGRDENIVVPTTVDDMKVVELKVTFDRNNYSFVKDKERVKSVDLRSAHHLKSISHSVFRNFKFLERVWCNDSLVEVGDAAFSDCESLAEFDFSNQLQFIYNNAFNRCSSLNALKINAKTISVGINAFMKCSRLKSIIINCEDLIIQHNAFTDCTLLETADANVSGLTIDESAFSNCRLLRSVNFEKATDKSRIGPSVFANCTNLKEILLSTKTDTIHANTFENCVSLARLKMPNSIKYVGKEAFRGCEALTSIDFSDYLKHIDYRAFYGCKRLDSLICNSSLYEIGEEAFGECTSLDYVYFNNDLQHVKQNAFYFTFINKIYIQRRITPYTTIYDVSSYRNVDTICFSRGTRYPTTGLWQYLDVEWVAY